MTINEKWQLVIEKDFTTWTGGTGFITTWYENDLYHFVVPSRVRKENWIMSYCVKRMKYADQ